MKNRFLQLSFLAICCMFITGCSTALCVVPSTAPLPVDKGYTLSGEEVTGTSSAFSILFFGFGSDTPMYNALQDALKKSSGDALVNVKATYRVFNFLYLFGFYETEIKGRAVKFYNK